MKQIKGAAAGAGEHRATMNTAARPPQAGCCAGLHQLLLRSWRHDFPLQPAPLQQMARQVGASPVELQRAGQRLQRSGALQPIRPHWGDALPRLRLRLGWSTRSAAQQQALRALLGALPGCTWIGAARPGQRRLPTLWAEIEALDAAAMQRQLARLPEAPVARAEVAQTQLAQAPLSDRELAAALERGLPFGTHPYAPLAERLGRSEKLLLAELHRWQRDGLLADLGLEERQPPPRYTARLITRTAPAAPTAQATTGAAAGHPGPGPLRCSEPSAAWPWRLWVLGSDGASRAGQRLHCEHPRAQALLFCDAEPAQAG